MVPSATPNFLAISRLENPRHTKRATCARRGVSVANRLALLDLFMTPCARTVRLAAFKLALLRLRRPDGGVSLASDDAARLLLGRHSQAQSQLSELIERLILTFRVLCDCPSAYHGD